MPLYKRTRCKRKRRKSRTHRKIGGAAPKGTTGAIPLALQKKLNSQQGTKSGNVTTYEQLSNEFMAEEYLDKLKQQLYFLELEHSQLKGAYAELEKRCPRPPP